MHCEHNCTCCPSAASQSLDEMDFERGIWYAAQHGDIEGVRKHLKRGEVDQRHTGYTALHYAARNGHLDVCKLLIDNGANINAVTNGGVTALSRAASTGNKEIVEYLLIMKADPFVKDSDGKTALHKASENGHIHICKILLSVTEKLKDVEDHRGNKDFVFPTLLSILSSVLRLNMEAKNVEYVFLGGKPFSKDVYTPLLGLDKDELLSTDLYTSVSGLDEDDRIFITATILGAEGWLQFPNNLIGLRVPPAEVLNKLAQRGFRLVSTTSDGNGGYLWTMQKEVRSVPTTDFERRLFGIQIG